MQRTSHIYHSLILSDIRRIDIHSYSNCYKSNANEAAKTIVMKQYLLIYPFPTCSSNILTFGKHTFPILKMKDRDVTILAAAQLGKGRVIGAAHKSYAEMFGGQYMGVSRSHPFWHIISSTVKYIAMH